jgi:hypothetical protein
MNSESKMKVATEARTSIENILLKGPSLSFNAVTEHPFKTSKSYYSKTRASGRHGIV